MFGTQDWSKREGGNPLRTLCSSRGGVWSLLPPHISLAYNGIPGPIYLCKGKILRMKNTMVECYCTVVMAKKVAGYEPESA